MKKNQQPAAKPQETTAPKNNDPAMMPSAAAAYQSVQTSTAAPGHWLTLQKTLGNHKTRQLIQRQTLHGLIGDVQDQAMSQPLLKIGSQGSAVKILQNLLNLAGAVPALVVDGAFGPKTHNAVQTFQSQNSLVPDGIVGPKTWGTLERIGPGGAEQTSIEETGNKPNGELNSQGGTGQSDNNALIDTIIGQEEVESYGSSVHETDKQSVAPSNVAQNGYQLTSQAYPDNSTLIGEIFFATGDSTVFGDDNAAINQIATAYYNQGKPWEKILILGYADHRPYQNDADQTKLQALTLARANNVREQLSQAFIMKTASPYGGLVTPSSPKLLIDGRGIDLRSPQYTGNNATDANLARFRRADIIVVEKKGPQPQPPAEPVEPYQESEQTISRKWFARVRVSGGFGNSIGAEGAIMEIVSQDTTAGMVFIFGAGTISAGNVFVDAGGPTRWEPFTTSKPIPVSAFAGSTEHTNLKLKFFGTGGAMDNWRLYGPMDNAGAQPVMITFSDVIYPTKEDRPWYEDVLDVASTTIYPQVNASTTLEGQLMPYNNPF